MYLLALTGKHLSSTLVLSLYKSHLFIDKPKFRIPTAYRVLNPQKLKSKFLDETFYDYQQTPENYDFLGGIFLQEN